MKNQEETKRWKAKQLRYKKPIVRDLNLDKIQEDLWNITEECENIRWYTDSDDGNDSLINALDGDEDEAYEFKMAFADLCAECERMQEDLREEWIPNCFDIFFVAAGAGENFGGLLGWDSFEGDYFGIDGTDAWAEDEAKKKLKTMTKDELIAATRQCFKVYQSYIGLRNRYDSLKAAIDILRDQNTGFLQTIKEIERLYEAASKEQGITCYLCMKLHNDYRQHPALQEHHIFGGCPNRTHSGHYGLKVYLCNVHHLAGTGPEAVHSNQKVMDMLHEEGQRAFEDWFGSREEFMKIFGKNFIMEDHKHDGH